MDDVTRLEQRLADDALRVAGPPRPIDVDAVYAATITATQSPSWRFKSMFSATKLVVAGAIVALLGGFLLAGVLTQSSEESAPGAVSASPSPSTTEDLLSGMTTEEVEPGVFRVVDDGLRALSRAGEDDDLLRGALNIVAGLDGSVWWFGPDGFFRLGDPPDHGWPESGPVGQVSAWDDLAVTPDGTLWRFGAGVLDPSQVVSFDGQSWTELSHGSTGVSDRDLTAIGGVEVRADGTVWIAWADPSPGGDPRDLTVTRLTQDGWEQVPAAFPWVRFEEMHLAVAEEAEGAVWLFGGLGDYRLDEAEWQRQSPPRPARRGDVGPDGTLWIVYDQDADGRSLLARLDGSEWTEFTLGLPSFFGPYQGFEGWFEVAPDGSVWFNPDQDRAPWCDGVANFDGESLAQFLRDTCIFAMDVAPDGTVWLLASPDDLTDVNRIHTYVITPEAVAVTE